MPILPILQYPDDRLHKVAKKVDSISGEVLKLISDMAETMYAAPGIGLAATQVDVHLQIIVIDVSETHNDLQVLINPELVYSEGENKYEEGCLSVPGIYDLVQRAEKIEIRALNAQGEKFALKAEGILSVCIQHEMDHLKGIVFVEHLSHLKQVRIRSKLKKRLRETF
jgi:peptide deformylase